MIGKSKKPSKAEVIRSIQSSKESDIAVIEPVSSESINDVLKVLKQKLEKYSFGSIVLVLKK
jgi:hypothetical protein